MYILKFFYYVQLYNSFPVSYFIKKLKKAYKNSVKKLYVKKYWGQMVKNSCYVQQINDFGCKNDFEVLCFIP